MLDFINYYNLNIVLYKILKKNQIMYCRILSFILFLLYFIMFNIRVE